MEFKKDAVEIQTVATCLEQRIKAGSQFTGEAPSLAGAAFAPYFDTEDCVARYKQANDSSKIEGDKGGLFEWQQTFPVCVEGIAANFGSAVTWTVSVVTRTGDVIQVATGSSSQYIMRTEYERIYLFRGDKLKIVTSGGTLAMVARIVLRLDSGLT
jgi:hypothetical protein